MARETQPNHLPLFLSKIEQKHHGPRPRPIHPTSQPPHQHMSVLLTCDWPSLLSWVTHRLPSSFLTTLLVYSDILPFLSISCILSWTIEIASGFAGGSGDGGISGSNSNTGGGGGDSSGGSSTGKCMEGMFIVCVGGWMVCWWGSGFFVWVSHTS